MACMESMEPAGLYRYFRAFIAICPDGPPLTGERRAHTVDDPPGFERRSHVPRVTDYDNRAHRKLYFHAPVALEVAYRP